MNAIACIRQSSDTSNENWTPSLFPQGFTVNSHFLTLLNFFSTVSGFASFLSYSNSFQQLMQVSSDLLLRAIFMELRVFFGFCLNLTTSARYFQRMLYLITIHQPPLCSQKTYGRCSRSLFYPFLFHPFSIGLKMNCKNPFKTGRAFVQ